VVFLAFWQGLVVEGLVWGGVIREDHWYSTDELEDALQVRERSIHMRLLVFPFGGLTFPAAAAVSAAGWYTCCRARTCWYA